MKLKFSSDLDSAKRLDEIMNSYSGRDRGSILADEHSLAVTLVLLEHERITVTEHTYPYDQDIQGDSEMMEVYSGLARETRWKRFSRTEIERIRINALRQMQQEGKPFYDGEFMCWREGRVFAHCGNLNLPQLLLYLASHEQAQQFYLFTYPYWTEDPLQNTTASTCLKPLSRVRRSTVSPFGRKCVKHPRPASSSPRFPSRRMIRYPRHKNTKAD